MARSATKLTTRALGGALSLASLGMGWLATGETRSVAPDYSEVESILRAQCGQCHGANNPSSGLDLSSFAGLMKGGDSGKAVIPGDSKKSEIMVRIRGEGGLPQMPMGFAPLTPKQIQLIADWIDAGAKPAAKRATHWAYVPPKRPAVPTVKNGSWVRNPIDAFVLKRLEKEGLKPSPPADRITLLRRVTLDLTGLPPTPAEVDAFLADSSKDAYEKVVDRLLASPHYGEKMALPWLDAARYADSNGFQQDGDTYQYVWRDWVVRAMNANMPFDRFATLQIAGDLLPEATIATRDGRDALIATGFNRNHMLNGEGGAIPEEQRFVGLFDRVDTTSTVFTGLTMTCARCHDHKYDPISQKDYYRMMAYFNRVPESGTPTGGNPYNIGPTWIYAGNDDQMKRLFILESQTRRAAAEAKQLEASPATKDAEAKWRANPGEKAPKEILELLKLPSRNADQERRLHQYFMDDVLRAEPWERSKRLSKELGDLKAVLPRVMVMSDKQKRDTHVLNRGNYEEKLEKVEPGVPAMFGAKGPIKDRLGLAKWIVDRKNPLTSRVQVNRYWQTFFGQGLVKTSENFGVQSSPPSHPELLDWMAVDFMESGWNVKRLHRMIVTSATYRQSSKVTPALLKRDQDNALYARGPRFRLPSMLLRDVALASSGLIDNRIGGKPVYPYQPKGIWSGLQITEERDFTYPQSKGADLYRRSIYTFWRRTVAPGNMFDASSRQVCTVRDGRTSTPLHALTMLNDVTWVEAGRALATRAMLKKSEDGARLSYAFELVCSRTPSAGELALLSRSLQKARTAFKSDPKATDEYLSVGESKVYSRLDRAELAALAAVCLSIYNLDEAMTKE